LKLLNFLHLSIDDFTFEYKKHRMSVHEDFSRSWRHRPFNRESYCEELRRYLADAVPKTEAEFECAKQNARKMSEAVWNIPYKMGVPVDESEKAFVEYNNAVDVLLYHDKRLREIRRLQVLLARMTGSGLPVS